MQYVLNAKLIVRTLSLYTVQIPVVVLGLHHRCAPATSHVHCIRELLGGSAPGGHPRQPPPSSISTYLVYAHSCRRRRFHQAFRGYRSGIRYRYPSQQYSKEAAELTAPVASDKYQ